jgi:sulfite exporter TauE/SafE
MHLIPEAFVLGVIYGFGPCTLSCAPVLVPIVMSTSKGLKQGILYTLAFSLGRILVYTLLGAVMGAIGSIFSISIPHWLIGVFLIMLGIALFFNLHTKCLVSRVRVTGLHMSFVAGVVLGFSPCAPLLGALGLAIASKSALTGGLIAIAFGIGTVLSPILLIGALSGKWASVREFKGINNYVAGAFLVLVGLYFLFQ